MSWVLGWFGFFVLGTIYHHIKGDVTDATWMTYWRWKSGIIITFIATITIWYLFGGLRDIADMFKTLGTVKRNSQDDGTVAEHLNLADEIMGTQEQKLPDKLMCKDIDTQK